MDERERTIVVMSPHGSHVHYNVRWSATLGGHAQYLTTITKRNRFLPSPGMSVDETTRLGGHHSTSPIQLETYNNH